MAAPCSGERERSPPPSAIVTDPGGRRSAWYDLTGPIPTDASLRVVPTTAHRYLGPLISALPTWVLEMPRRYNSVSPQGQLGPIRHPICQIAH